MNEGWICSRCKASNAPFITQCKCSKQNKHVYAISVDTLKDRDAINLELFDSNMLVHVGETNLYYKLNTHDNWTEYHPAKRVVILNIKA